MAVVPSTSSRTNPLLPIMQGISDIRTREVGGFDTHGTHIQFWVPRVVRGHEYLQVTGLYRSTRS